MGATINPLDPFSIGVGAWENERSIEAQRNNNRLNREFMAEQNQLDRDFQERINQQTMQSQQDFQREMYQMQNEYNLPSNLVARLQAAGINPAALLAGSAGGQFVSSQGAASSPGSPAGVIPGSHSVSSPGSLNTPMNSFSSLFSSLAQLQASAAAAKKSGADVKRIEVLLPLEAENIQAETEKQRSDQSLNEANKILVDVEAELKKAYGSEKEAAEISKLLSESYKAMSDGDASLARAKFDEANARLTNTEADIKEESKDELVRQVGLYNNVLKAQETAAKASAAASYAAAEESKAGAALKREQRYTVQLDNDFNEATFQSRVVQLMNEAKASEKLPEQVENQIKLQLKELEWSDAEHRAGVVAKIIGSLGTAVGAAAGAFVGVRGLQLRSVKPTSVKGFGGVR